MFSPVAASEIILAMTYPPAIAGPITGMKTATLKAISNPLLQFTPPATATRPPRYRNASTLVSEQC